MKKLVIGLLAHVDAGKTTLSEYMLFKSGAVRKQGRVDHRDTFLDTHSLERERGITIFSKQARMSYENTELVLIDTPGHVDFSAEMERTLSVLDAAILLISASDGIGPYTKTLFGLLERMSIPTFIFVNKMDVGNITREDFITVLKDKLSPLCHPLDMDIAGEYEDIALCDERIMEEYLETGEISDEDIRYLINNRKLIPCYFGSALKGTGVEKLLSDICFYSESVAAGEAFSARVYKIGYDDKNQRVTFMRLFGGKLRSKDNIIYPDGSEEKINQIRLYSGSRFSPAETVESGDICGILGLEKTRAGMALGDLGELMPESLASVISYRVMIKKGTVNAAYNALKTLCEEDPALKVRLSDKEEIFICIMGEVHMQVLKVLLRERFDLEVDFDLGDVVYQETIQNSVVGIGHFEPLRHYAEVHLLLEPAPAGTGIQYSSICSTDVLALPYQKQILNALEADNPIGVLTGSELTDVYVKLISGKAHDKHTEGGDLRQAALRALRMGLMRGTSLLLEPYEEFSIKLQSKLIGKLMTELKRLDATISEPDLDGEYSVLKGRGPVSTLTAYKKEFYAYTSGDGSWDGRVCGFFGCHNSEEVVGRIGYSPEADLQHSPDSVFCAHGAGYTVKWNDVPNMAHIPADSYRELLGLAAKPVKQLSVKRQNNTVSSEEELEAIFERTFGKSKRERYPYKPPKTIAPKESAEVLKDYSPRQKKQKKNILIVDGYNVVFDWQDLRELARENMDAARDKLIDRLVNYQAFTKKDMLVVFDAYRTPNPNSKQLRVGDIDIVFTARNETADMYIQKYASDNSSLEQISVVTSDGLEQINIFSQGGLRISSREFLEEVKNVEALIREKID